MKTQTQSEWALKICADVSQATTEDQQTVKVIRWVKLIRDEIADEMLRLAKQPGAAGMVSAAYPLNQFARHIKELP